MATPLDTSLLQHFEVLFPFLFILVISYAILSSVPIFGKNNAVKAFLAFLFAVGMLFSPIARETINTAAPWFIVLIVFIVLTLVVYMSLGATWDDITGTLQGGSYRYINLWVIALVLIIVFGSLSSVLARYGGVGNELNTDDGMNLNSTGKAASAQESDFWSSLFHPKVLGLILLLLISVFTILRLTKD